MKRYTLYIDESGSGELTDHRHDFLILTGLIVEHDEDMKISAYFNYLKLISGLPHNKPFHSYDIFEDNKSPLYLTDVKSTKLADSIRELIKVVPIKINIEYLNKNDLRKFLGMNSESNHYFKMNMKENISLPYEILASKIFFWFADFLKGKKAIGAIVLESRSELDHPLLKTYLRSKSSAQYSSANLKKKTETMKKYVTSIRFEGKGGLWPILELADLVSYLAYQNKNNSMAKLKGRGVSKIWTGIKNQLDDKKIKETNKNGYKAHIPKNRVRKISNYIKLLEDEQPRP